MTPQQRLLNLTSNENLGTGGVWFLLGAGVAACIGIGYWLAKKSDPVA